jgi:predicted nucleotidyltransferase
MNGQPDIALLEHVFRGYEDVEAVYLFGSAASGRTQPASDLDLAVVPRHPRVVARRLDILADLARIGYCEVDLVFLNTDDLVLAYEAVRLNQLVYARKFRPRGLLFPHRAQVPGLLALPGRATSGLPAEYSQWLDKRSFTSG